MQGANDERAACPNPTRLGGIRDRSLHGTIVTRVYRVIAHGPATLTDPAMAELPEDLRAATEMIRSEYHERTGRRLANPGPRDVLTVWVEATHGGPDYVKTPGDRFIVHTVIPEIMSPPMSLPFMS